MKRTEHREEKWIFPFIKYSPEKHDDGEKLPLIIQLHGAGERGAGKEDLINVEVHGLSNVVKKKDYECILVLPQCPTNTFWVARIESILAFIQQVIDEYNIDENRIYITGLSMGGYGTWYTAMAKPKLFAAAVPVCGGGMAWNCSVIKKLPIWAFHGVEDAVVNVSCSDEMVKKLESIGAPVKYTRVEGVGHNVWVNAYNDELMQWLLEQRKN